MVGCSLQSDGLDTDESFQTSDASRIDASAPVLDDGALETLAPMDSFVETDSAVVDSTAGDTRLDTSSDAGCAAAPATATPCDKLPARQALATGQTLDGRADDFCDVPYVDFANGVGAVRDPNPTPTEAQTTMRIRVAWSTFGVHAHVAVRDSKLLVAMPATEKFLFYGDSIEIYVAGYDALTGSFDGATKDYGAQQIIIAPPTADGTVGTRATYFYGAVGAKGSPLSDRWFSRVTAEGYEIELRLPWADLKPAAMPVPVAGKKIALTWAFNNKYDAAKQQAFSVFQARPVGIPPVPACGQPYCDDRMWCTPTLQ